jgi:hypothetical protein
MSIHSCGGVRMTLEPEGAQTFAATGRTRCKIELLEVERGGKISTCAHGRELMNPEGGCKCQQIIVR